MLPPCPVPPQIDLIQYVTADDRAVPVVLTGRLAAVYKELVCNVAVWSVATRRSGCRPGAAGVTRELPAASPAVQAMA